MNELIDKLIDILNVEETTDSEKIDQIYDLLQKLAADTADAADAADAADEDMSDEEVLKAVEG